MRARAASRGAACAQVLVGRQLAPPLPAPPRQVLGVQGEVAAEPSVAVAEAVAPQLAVDGGRVAAEPGRDLADRGAGLDEAKEGTALVEVEVAVGPGQGPLRRASPRKGWGFALRDRTHPKQRVSAITVHHTRHVKTSCSIAGTGASRRR